MNEEIVVRASSTSGWPDCNRRGAATSFAFLVKMMGFQLRRRASHVGALIGSGVHTAAKIMLEEKAKTGELPPATVYSEAGIEEMYRRAEEDGEGVILDDETPNMNVAEQQIVRMANAYRHHIAPGITPLIVEQRFEARVPWTVNPIILSGQMDVIAVEPNRIRDLKTGKHRGNHRPQLGSYGLLARSHITDTAIIEACEDYVPRHSLKRPQQDPVTTMYDLRGCETAAIAVIKHMDSTLTTFLEGDEPRRILPGDPWAFPANPSSLLCSEKFCPAFGTDFCKEHKEATGD